MSAWGSCPQQVRWTRSTSWYGTLLKGTSAMLWKGLAPLLISAHFPIFLVHSWDFNVFCRCPWLMVELITVFCYCDRRNINGMPRCSLWEGSSGPRSLEMATDSGFQTSFARQNCCPITSFAFITICVLTDLFTSLWVNLRSICACWLKKKPAGLLEKHHRKLFCCSWEAAAMAASSRSLSILPSRRKCHTGIP